MTSEHFLQPAPAILPSNAPPRAAPILAGDKVPQAQPSSYSDVPAAVHNSLTVPNGTYYRPKTRRELEQDFQILWQRLYACDRYRKYRGAYDGREGNRKTAEKWPLEHEEAFFRGKLGGQLLQDVTDDFESLVEIRAHGP